jgi:hypothetical protein
MQVRLEGAQAFAEYRTTEGWKRAKISQCPMCRGRVTGWGSYGRKAPLAARVARVYCGTCRQTLSLLPDFYASHYPGLLSDIEDAARHAASAPSRDSACEAARPAAEDVVSLGGAQKWLRRRLRIVKEALTTALGLFADELSGCAPTLAAFHARLSLSPTSSVLVLLREKSARYLARLASPLGFLRVARGGVMRQRTRPHAMGPVGAARPP